MLPDQVTELLTAFVDGELSQRQRKAVMRLLHKSSEAREMLKQLQENAHKLKQLPFQKVKPSLVGDILQAIAEHKAQPKPPTPSRGARRRWLPYVAASLAASILLAAFGTLYWQTMMGEGEGPGPEKPKFVKKELPQPNKIEPRPDPAPQPQPPVAKKLPPLLDQLVQGTFNGFNEPIPPPFGATFAELQNGKKSLLEREIDSEKALVFDIKVKTNTQAMDRLQDVLRADLKITLVTDESAAKPVNNKKVQYLVYADNLKPGEVKDLMAKLGQGYVKSSGNNEIKMQSPYNNVTVTPIDENDKQKLDKLPAAAAKPNAKAERKAVVLPVNSANAPSAAAAAQFANRPAPQAGTLQVLIRIRQD